MSLSKASRAPAEDGAARAPRPGIARRRSAALAGPAMAIAALALLAGCQTNPTDSVVVGAIPDDYRTTHPIVISEKDQVLDLPVGAGERGMTGLQQGRLDGFLSEYDRSAAPVLAIVAPVGGVNQVAASYAARDFARRAKRIGIPPSRVVISQYQASASDVSPPIRIVYTAMRAHTDQCGRWPEDLTDTVENKHYANFGCAMQNNLAAQVANPADLLGPRRRGEIDAENRKRSIDLYERRGVSDEFLGNSEINY